MPVQRPTPPATLAPQVPPQSPAAARAPGAGVVPTAQAAVQPSPVGPPVAPVVTYRDGLLSVQAVNSSLSSVVSAIRNKTGIEFEGAEGISERVAIALGPAPEGDVLAAIFAGSKYDFLAIGRADSPSIVQKVILTIKGAPGAAPEAQTQQQPPANQGGEEEVPDEQVNNGDPQDTPAQPPQPPPPPQAETPQNQQPKTPEQLLQELQEMRRQKGSPEDPTNNPNPAPRKTPPN
ncbi:MAG TPA: hypothetical protein VHV32_05525 [Candidatus Angelobacter sp.]|nr:hypothetical protein [Candidatus Angelobacter sp.]